MTAACVRRNGASSSRGLSSAGGFEIFKQALNEFLLSIAFSLTIAVVGLSIPAAVAATEVWPALPVETLAGQRLIVPGDLDGNAYLFVIGFSRESSTHTEVWVRRVFEEYGKSARLAIHQVAVLWDVPRFVRRFVVRSIKSSVPRDMQGDFLVATDKFDDWKRLADYAQPDSAYIVLVNKRHEIAWRQAGAWSGASFETLANRLRALDLDQ